MKLQFKDELGRTTKVAFHQSGKVIVTTFNHLEMFESRRQYSKDSPIAAMYQQLLHNSREVEPNLFQVVGAW
jgi:hypothetical protein